MEFCRKDQAFTRYLACFNNNGPQTDFSCLWHYSFFYAYSAIVDSFLIVSFFWEILHSAALSLTKKLSLCLIKPMFWSRWLLFWVWWTIFGGVACRFFMHTAMLHLVWSSFRWGSLVMMGCYNGSRTRGAKKVENHCSMQICSSKNI